MPEGICWGGECAAYQVNGYLTPQKFEIYTDVAWGNLMKTGAMRATEGEITMYQKFLERQYNANNSYLCRLIR